jgi:DNA-binding winged helix-turn-helix (wHTH) protein
MPPGSGFAFGPFQLDPRARHLRRDGQLVSLPVRQFDLLHALVAHPDEILAKDELIKAAWPDVEVTDNSLAQAIMSLRGVIEADGSPCAIATARGLGYRSPARSNASRRLGAIRISTRCSRRTGT